MIYCVWYPSGGFGHFVNSVLNLYGHNFVRPQTKLLFGKDGNSHNVDYVAPPYTKDQDFYNFDFTDANYSVIIDNGINNESTKFTKFFPNATVVKICYDDLSWPVVAHTMIVKALNTSIDNELVVDKESWQSNESWAKREKYFLFLRDHPLRHAWRPDNISHAVLVNHLFDYNTMVHRLEDIGIRLDTFVDVWDQWFESNQRYIEPVSKAQDMISGTWHTLTDIWEQSVFYYQVWCKYGIEVPHNDFAKFFASQSEYQQWLESVL